MKMGKATRWLMGFLGMKKEKEIPKQNNESEFRRDKRRWSFARPGRDLAAPLGQIQVNIPVAGESESGWLGNSLSETEKEQNKLAIAVAAHVRGYLVRKQATATLHSMQALVRDHRARRSIGKDGLVRMASENRGRRSMERFEEPRSEYHYSPKELFYTTKSTPSTAVTTPTLGTPFLSSKASPVQSCHVSKKLNPEEYFLECSNGEKPFHGSKNSSLLTSKIRRSFSGAFKMLATTKTKGLMSSSSLLTSKIRASQACIKCLFNKSIANNKNDVKVCHRRSFSGAFKMHATTKTKGVMSSSSSGSSSWSSSNSNGVQLYKRSTSERERAIAEAIAYCKQSQSKVISDQEK